MVMMMIICFVNPLTVENTVALFAQMTIAEVPTTSTFLQVEKAT